MLCLGHFSSYRVDFSSLKMRGFALSYWILFCPVWKSSLGDLLLSEVEAEREWVRMNGKVLEVELQVEAGETVVGIYCTKEEPSFKKSS